MDRLIKAYVEATPSTYFNLSHYIFAFPVFAKTQAYLADYPMAHDLIQLETALTTVFDRTETAPLQQEQIAFLTPEAFMEYPLKTRAALELFTFAYPVSEYYRAVKEEEKPAAPAKEASYLAVYRHDDVMCRLPLEAEEYALMSHLCQTESVGEALGALVEQGDVDPEHLAEQLQRWFGRWIRNGVLAAA